MRFAIIAPDGIGEVQAGDDLALLVRDAMAADPEGPLADGDIVVVTSKIVSKAEGRVVPAQRQEEALEAESVRTVARRGPVRIVVNRLGIIQAAAGIDASNVDAAHVLLLPADADASAAALQEALARCAGVRVGVVISDTAGRAWRVGQTDHAIGVAGVRPIEGYVGQVDPYGHELRVTEVAVADELAAAAELAKSKLGRRPVAVVRGLAHLLTDEPVAATSLLRPAETDMFARGVRESVLAAVLQATGQPERYEEIVALDDAARVTAVMDGAQHRGEALTDGEADLVAALLRSQRTASGERRAGLLGDGGDEHLDAFGVGQRTHERDVGGLDDDHVAHPEDGEQSTLTESADEQVVR